jgi:excisionase family DNA binding protein
MKMNENNEGPYIRANEVQKMLKVGRNKIYEWCKQNKIPHKRVDRIILFSRKRIQEWIENKEGEGDTL